MASRETRTVSFTPQQAKFVDKCVASGQYQSASEVVREGLRLLEQEKKERATAIKKIQAMIEEGARDLDEGRMVDGKQVMKELMGRHQRRLRSK